MLRDVRKVDRQRCELFGRRMAQTESFSELPETTREEYAGGGAANGPHPVLASTMSTRSIEDVAAVSDGPKWFQVYTWRDRGLVREMVERSAAAGYEALWLTVDTAVLGRRERDVRRGFTLPPKIGLETIFDGAVHPGWTLDFLRAEPITFSNVVNRGVDDGTTAVALASQVQSQFDPALSWDDVEWLRSIWDGPIVLKGIQTVPTQAGVAAECRIALSNTVAAARRRSHRSSWRAGRP